MLVYMLNGFCSALAGIALSIYVGSGHGLYAMGMELTVIGAVVIGGTLLTGGVGYVFGTLFGVLIIGLIQTLIQFNGQLSSWWTPIVVGAADAPLHRRPEPARVSSGPRSTARRASAERRRAGRPRPVRRSARKPREPAARAALDRGARPGPRAAATTSCSRPRRAPRSSDTSKGWTAVATAVGAGRRSAACGSTCRSATRPATGARWPPSTVARRPSRPATARRPTAPTVVVGSGGHRLAPGFRMRGFIGGTKARAGARTHPGRVRRRDGGAGREARRSTTPT